VIRNNTIGKHGKVVRNTLGLRSRSTALIRHVYGWLCFQWCKLIFRFVVHKWISYKVGFGLSATASCLPIVLMLFLIQYVAQGLRGCNIMADSFLYKCQNMNVKSICYTIRCYLDGPSLSLSFCTTHALFRAYSRLCSMKDGRHLYRMLPAVIFHQRNPRAT